MQVLSWALSSVMHLYEIVSAYDSRTIHVFIEISYSCVISHICNTYHFVTHYQVHLVYKLVKEL